MIDYTGSLGQHDSRIKDVLKWAVVIRMPGSLSVRVLARGRQTKARNGVGARASQGRLARCVFRSLTGRSRVKHDLFCCNFERVAALLRCQLRASCSTGHIWSGATSCGQDCVCCRSMTCNDCSGLWICADRRFLLLC